MISSFILLYRFTHDKPGVVLIKQTPVDEEVEVQMLRDPEYRFTQEDIPRVLLAPGVSRERQTYLYRNVRRYVRDIAKDLTCPRPSDAEE